MGSIQLWAGTLVCVASCLAQQYTIATYAGGAPLTTPGAEWDVSIAADSAGNQYVAAQHTIFKRDANGIWTRIAGNSRPGYSGDGGPALDAQLNQPWGVTVDAGGNMFIADLNNHRVRIVNTDGIITTAAGNGNPASSGEGGQATAAGMSPVSVAVDANGNLFIGESSYGVVLTEGWGVNLVRKVSPDGIITTIAGGGQDRSGTGPALNAVLSGPVMIAADASGNVFIADSLSAAVRKVSTDGTISIIAASNSAPASGPLFKNSCSAGSASGPATLTTLCLPFGVAVDRAGSVFVAEFGYRAWYDLGDPILSNFAVRKISPDGIITTVAGSTTPGLSDRCDCADVGRGSVAVDDTGTLYYSDSFRTRTIGTDGAVATILDDWNSLFSGDGGPAAAATLYGPAALATDPDNNLFIADRYNSRVRRVSTDGIITTVAGNGAYAFSGDGGPAISAAFQDIVGVAVDGAGNLFIADANDNRVRRVSTDGIIDTVAGGGDDPAGDGGAATKAQLNGVAAVAADASGNLFVAERTRVRKVTPDGIISTVLAAGVLPVSLAVDRGGNLLVADRNGDSVRRVTPDGTMATVLAAGDHDIAVLQVAVDQAGNVLIATAADSCHLRTQFACGGPERLPYRNPGRWRGRGSIPSSRLSRYITLFGNFPKMMEDDSRLRRMMLFARAMFRKLRFQMIDDNHSGSVLNLVAWTPGDAFEE